MEKIQEKINSLQKELEQHNYSQKEKAILQKELHSLNTERQALLKEAYEYSEVYAKMKQVIQSYKKQINPLNISMKKTGNNSLQKPTYDGTT